MEIRYWIMDCRDKMTTGSIYHSAAGVTSPAIGAPGTPANCKNATATSTLTESTSSLANTNPAVPLVYSGDSAG